MKRTTAATCRIISAAFTTLYYADNDTLTAERLSLSDYWTAREVMEQLRKPGTSATTIIFNVAEYFRRKGYNVQPDGIGYKISI